MKAAMVWSAGPDIQSTSHTANIKRDTIFFFTPKRQDLHFNKMVAIETVNYTFSRARLCLSVENCVTANIIHTGYIISFKVNLRYFTSYSILIQYVNFAPLGSLKSSAETEIVHILFSGVLYRVIGAYCLHHQGRSLHAHGGNLKFQHLRVFIQKYFIVLF